MCKWLPSANPFKFIFPRTAFSLCPSLEGQEGKSGTVSKVDITRFSVYSQCSPWVSKQLFSPQVCEHRVCSEAVWLGGSSIQPLPGPAPGSCKYVIHLFDPFTLFQFKKKGGGYERTPTPKQQQKTINLIEK